MRAAGEEILECYRVLGKAGLNVVGEVLRGQGEFREHDHYPNEDVYDAETRAYYYYHARRGMPGMAPCRGPEPHGAALPH